MNSPFPTVDVLGISLFSQNVTTACDLLIQDCTQGTKDNRCVSATGAHGLVYAKKNTAFRELLQSFYINLPDGTPSVWVGRLQGAKQMERCAGPLFFEEVMKQSSSQSITHFFCGGNDGTAEALKEACSQKFGNNKIVGTYEPPFLPVEEFDYQGIANEIAKVNPDVIWVGLGTPKQEQFAKQLARHVSCHYLITVGAAFDFHTDKLKKAPKLIEKMGVEWLFRLCMEPKRLFKRYFEIVPKFIFYAVLQLTFKK